MRVGDGEGDVMGEEEGEVDGDGEGQGGSGMERVGVGCREWEGLYICERRGIGSEEMGYRGTYKDIVTKRGRGEGEVGWIGTG